MSMGFNFIEMINHWGSTSSCHYFLPDFFNEPNSRRLSTEEHIESEIKLQHTKIKKIKGDMRSKIIILVENV